MTKLSFERRKVLEALIKSVSLAAYPFKPCILKTPNVNFFKFATWVSSLFDSFVRLSHIIASLSQRKVLVVS